MCPTLFSTLFSLQCVLSSYPLFTALLLACPHSLYEYKQILVSRNILCKSDIIINNHILRFLTADLSLFLFLVWIFPPAPACSTGKRQQILLMNWISKDFSTTLIVQISSILLHVWGFLGCGVSTVTTM
jgi:hypothetical protein